MALLTDASSEDEKGSESEKAIVTRMRRAAKKRQDESSR